jgi:nucleotide-binding universal stress UspA family protein
MSDVQRVVVGMDLEAPGDTALRWALAHAARAKAVEIHVVHVIPTRAENLAVLSRALEGGLATLRARVVAIAADGGVATPVQLHVRLGDVASTLEQVAIDYDADLVVVGTHGRTGAARLVLGSVASAITKSAHLPVLVAKEKDFTGLARTPALDAPRPGAELHRDQRITDVVHIGRRDSHISGLV